MEDTLSRHSFVLFACDSWSIAAEFSVTSPTALASELSALREMFVFPAGVGWRRVAREAFRGVPVLVNAGDNCAAYLLLKGASVRSYDLDGRRLVPVDTRIWTWVDHLQAVSEFSS